MLGYVRRIPGKKVVGMGSTYMGPPFADAIGYEAHEGYTLSIADGVEQGRDQIIAACACGWRGTAKYADDEYGEELAHEEWDHHHLRSLLHNEGCKRLSVGADVLVALVQRMRDEKQGKAADMLGELLDELPYRGDRKGSVW